MKKLAVLLVSLFMLAVGTAVTLACLSDHMLSIVSNGSTFGGPGADSMRDLVVQVALEDPAINTAINGSIDGKYELHYIKSGEVGKYTYVKDFEKYAWLEISINYSGEPVGFNVIVDTATMNETAVQFLGSPALMNSWVSIPPGNGIYTAMSSNMSSSPDNEAVRAIYFSEIQLIPENASIYPLILDEDNFTNLTDGSPYEAADLVDPQTGQSVKVDGSKPVSSGWSAFYLLPNGTYGPDTNRYYLVLFNEDTSDVTVVHKDPLVPFEYDLHPVSSS